MVRGLGIGGFVLVAACTRSPRVNVDASSPTELVRTAVEVDSATVVPATPRVPVALAPIRFERAKLTFDGLSGVTPDVTRWDVGGVFLQGRSLGSSDESFRIVVRSAPDSTLDDFERDHSSFVLSPRAPTTVCGAPAEIVRATKAAEDVTCVMVVGGPDHPAYFPPRSVVAIAFSHPPLRTLFSVDVSASRPLDYAPEVDRILASIRCR